jgi:hypothetical protein
MEATNAKQEDEFVYAETAAAAQIRSYLLRSGSHDSALRSAAVAILASRPLAFPVLVPLLDRSGEPHLDQMQHIPIHDPSGDTL